MKVQSSQLILKDQIIRWFLVETAKVTAKSNTYANKGKVQTELYLDIKYFSQNKETFLVKKVVLDCKEAHKNYLNSLDQQKLETRKKIEELNYILFSYSSDISFIKKRRSYSHSKETQERKEKRIRELKIKTYNDLLKKMRESGVIGVEKEIFRKDTLTNFEKIDEIRVFVEYLDDKYPDIYNFKYFLKEIEQEQVKNFKKEVEEEKENIINMISKLERSLKLDGDNKEILMSVYKNTQSLKKAK